jgi:hypothetical protein
LVGKLIKYFKIGRNLAIATKKRRDGAWRGGVDTLDVKSIHIRDSIDRTIIFET